jgi:hypothetical protein
MRQKRVLALAAPGQRRRAAKDAGCQDGDVEVLSSRILLRPADLGRSRHFYAQNKGYFARQKLTVNFQVPSDQPTPSSWWA